MTQKMEKAMGSERYRAIDVMKGLAMVMVILVHYNQSFDLNIAYLKFCQMGCQIFFVASGFGVSSSFAKKRSTASDQNVRWLFYISRIRAIAPAWYLMMLVVYCTNTFVIALTGHTLSFGLNRDPLSIICNLLFLNGLLPFCNNDVMPNGWYIGTTMLFYLITPVLYICFEKAPALFVRRLRCLGLSMISVGIIVLLSLVFPRRETFLLANNSFGYFSVLTQFPCFALGMLLFFENSNQSLSRKKARIYGILGIILMVAASVLFFQPFTKYSYTITVILVGLSTYFILKYMMYHERSDRERKYSNFMYQMGKKSFYVYLVHGFFVWDFIVVLKRILNAIWGIEDSYILYFSLLPVVIILSYYSGCFFQFIIGRLIFLKSKFRDAKLFTRGNMR